MRGSEAHIFNRRSYRNRLARYGVTVSIGEVCRFQRADSVTARDHQADRGVVVQRTQNALFHLSVAVHVPFRNADLSAVHQFQQFVLIVAEQFFVLVVDNDQSAVIVQRNGKTVVVIVGAGQTVGLGPGRRNDFFNLFSAFLRGDNSPVFLFDHRRRVNFLCANGVNLACHLVCHGGCHNVSPDHIEIVVRVRNHFIFRDVHFRRGQTGAKVHRMHIRGVDVGIAQTILIDGECSVILNRVNEVFCVNCFRHFRAEQFGYVQIAQ